MAPRLKRRLLVEGRDEQFAISALMTQRGVDFGARAPFDPEIEGTEGVPNLLEAIPAAAKTYDRLGIVIDADDDPAARWSAVRGRLAALNPPELLPADGYVGPGLRPATRVGVWMMPDNGARGMLETFLATLVPPDDSAWPYTAEAVESARARGARFRLVEKARLHTWLAWQDPEGRPFGLAIRSQTLRHDSPVAARFANWFRRVLLEE